jgi:lysophospholipase L1-like esterase
MTNCINYLALGDSYTIGEGVLLHESYPYQLVQVMRAQGKEIYGPEIIAKTGWTTTELTSHLDHTILNAAYDVVSLLIGVNNQYRSLSPDEYALEFEELMQKSLSLARFKSDHVFVLSIPDWGKTPFAAGRDTKAITSQIALFNKINFDISKRYGAAHVDITTNSPETVSDPSFLAADGLHPSPKAYKRWASMVAERLIRVT